VAEKEIAAGRSWKEYETARIFPPSLRPTSGGEGGRRPDEGGSDRRVRDEAASSTLSEQRKQQVAGCTLHAAETIDYVADVME
jgi:hypothetical protein